MNLFPFFKTPAQQTVTAPVIDTPVSKPKKIYNTIKRSFSSVFSNTLTDLIGSPSLQQDLRHLETVRNQSRTLALNSPVIRRYLEIMKSTVVGANGISLQVSATTTEGSQDYFNSVITDHFDLFSQDVTVAGGISRAQLESLAVEYLCRDGEFIALIHTGTGDYNIQLQPVDPDHIITDYNDYFYETGNRVVGGVEIDQFGKPVAYWLYKHNPSDALIGSSQERIRYPAEQVIHIFDRERVSQTRGYPFTAPVIEEVHQLSKYREAVLVQARINASKARYFKQTQSDADPFADEADVDDEGHVTLAFSPNTVEVMPKGYDVVTADFNNSNQESLDSFQKSLLRIIAAGLGVSYHHLATDYADVNFSASKAAGIVDDAFIKTVQKLISENLTRRLYNEWLRIQLSTNQWGLNLPFARYQKFKKIRLTPPAFRSVDAIKDLQNDQGEYELGITSLSELAEKRGKNLEDILRQRQSDDQLLSKYGQTKEAVIDAIKKAA